MSTVTVRFGSIGLFIWAGLGLLYHLMTSDIPFTWADPWLYVTMAIWPLYAFTWVVIFIAGCFALFAVVDAYQRFAKQRRFDKSPKGQKMKRRRLKVKQQKEEQRKAPLPHDPPRRR